MRGLYLSLALRATWRLSVLFELVSPTARRSSLTSFLKAAGNAGQGKAQFPQTVSKEVEPVTLEAIWRGLARAIELSPGASEEGYRTYNPSACSSIGS